MIFAFISRFKQVPVRTYEWFLLFIGVSNGNQGVMILFVMWFAYMYWREQITPYTKTGLFNSQSNICCWYDVVCHRYPIEYHS